MSRSPGLWTPHGFRMLPSWGIERSKKYFFITHVFFPFLNEILLIDVYFVDCILLSTINHLFIVY